MRYEHIELKVVDDPFECVDDVFESNSTWRPFGNQAGNSDYGDVEFDVVYEEIAAFSHLSLADDLLSVMVDTGDQVGFVPEDSEVLDHSLGDELLPFTFAGLVHYYADSFFQELSPTNVVPVIH